MGLEKTAERIREEAKAECAGITEAANSEANGLLEKARADGKKLSEKIILKGQEDAAFEYEKCVTDARMEAGRKKMRLQSGLIQKAFEKSAAELEKFADGKEHPPILAKLAHEAVALLGEKKAVLYARKKDMKHIDLRKLSKESGTQIDFAKQPLDIPGVIAESADGRVRVDNTFAARMKRDEGALRKIVADSLFGVQ